MSPKFFLRSLARPTLLFWALPWLMLLLIAGTLAQRYIGLYPSQKLFFGSFILWVGAVPLPGAYSVLTVIAASLTAKLILKSPFTRAKMGTLITHASAIILLLGGLVTALDREEGYMVLAPGESSSTATDYHDRVLRMTSTSGPMLELSESVLHEGRELPGGNFSLRVLHYCHACAIVPRTGNVEAMHGLAAKVALQKVPEKEEPGNLSGIEFEVSGASPGFDGVYVAAQGLARDPVIQAGENTVTISLAQETRALPFAVRLAHFDKSDYPGTDMAQSYRSDVTVRDGGIERSETITMNAPLRLHGYTLYQSSYVESGGKLRTVLAVVKNAGDAFPYIAVATLCFGLIIHLAVTLRRKELPK